MPRTLALMICAAFIFCLPLDAACKDDSIWLLYASHMPDIQKRHNSGNHAELMSLLTQLRSEHDNVVFIHGGNYLGPSALSSYDKGAHMVGIMNYLEPDALGLGRRDFMHKEDELVLRSGEAVYPTVASNIADPSTGDTPKNISRARIIDSGSLKLGFLALVSPSMQRNYTQRRLYVNGDFSLLPQLSGDLRGQGADFVIASADFMPESIELTMDESGVDLLFISEAQENSLHMYNGRCYAFDSGNGQDVLLLELKRDEANAGKPSVASSQVIALSGYPQAQEVNLALDRYNKLFESIMDIQVGQTKTPLDTETRNVRTAENAMGNIVTDALRDYYKAEIGLINAGGIRGNRQYAAGAIITRGDLQGELPLHDVSCLIHVKGSILVQMLEYGVSDIEHAKGGFLQVSGLEYTYRPSSPAGSRIVTVTANGTPLNPNKIYDVSLPEYIAGGGGGFSMISEQCDSNAPRPPQELVEILRVYITGHSPISPKIEGRVHVVD